MPKVHMHNVNHGLAIYNKGLTNEMINLHSIRVVMSHMGHRVTTSHEDITASVPSHQESYCACTQPMRDDVTMKRRSSARHIHKMIHVSSFAAQCNIHCGAVIRLSIFSKFLTMDRPWLTGEAEIWGVLCEFKCDLCYAAVKVEL